ncbi:hypothetical protein [Sphingobacterium hungaricum]|nr:hypothetical protein [Sphingobacterium hungaricum]
MDSLQLKEIVGYLPYGLDVEYQGITNLKELSEHNSKEPKTFDIFDDDHEKWVISEPKAIIGRRVSKIKQIKFYKNYISVHVGTHHGYLKTVYLSDIKPILYPLSMLTQEIEHKGKRFVPIVELFKLKTQATGNEIFDYYIENDTAILRLKGQQLDEFTFKTYFEVDLEPNQVMFSIASETWVDDKMIEERLNQCGNEMKMFQQLYEWHFDIHNLIPRGLAVAKEVVNG